MIPDHSEYMIGEEAVLKIILEWSVLRVYYGYNLPYFDDIILLHQIQLFIEKDIDVKDDILQLLTEFRWIVLKIT